MNYGVIKKVSYDVQAYRFSLLLNVLFDVLFGLYFLLTWISYGEAPVSIVVSLIGVSLTLVLTTILIFFVTKKTLIFSKENVIIGNYAYDWNCLNIEYNTDIIPPIWNTICISFYDNKKNMYTHIYIKCKKSEYSTIMSIRN